MGKSYRNYNKKTYPEENENSTKDSNKKLKAEIKSLKKIIKNLEIENKTLKRSFDKSCDYINKKLSDKNIEEIIDMVNDYEYKETERGRKKEEKKKKEETKKMKPKECPECSSIEGKGFKIINFDTFKVHTCVCGYRTRVNQKDEGIERS